MSRFVSTPRAATLHIVHDRAIELSRSINSHLTHFPRFALTRTADNLVQCARMRTMINRVLRIVHAMRATFARHVADRIRVDNRCRN